MKMTDFMVRMFTDYPWAAWLTAVLAVCGLAYAGVWVHELAGLVSDWMAYRRLVWRSKAAVRRQIADNPGWDCAVCRDREALLLEALGPGDLETLMRGDDPPEYQHPDGDDLDYCDHGVIERTCPVHGYDWDGPGEDWSPGLAWGPGMPVPNPMAGLAEVLSKAYKMGLLDDDQLPDGLPAEPESMHEWHDHAPLGYHDEAVAGCPQCEARWEVPPADAPEERCTNRDCDLFGFLHRPPCRLSPTMPAACYPDFIGPRRPDPWECPRCHCLFELPGFHHEPCLTAIYRDGPAMPPQPWSGLEASLEVLARGDDDKPLHPQIQADLEAAGFRAHDTTEGLVDTSYTRAQAKEVQAMITDGVIAPE